MLPSIQSAGDAFIWITSVVAGFVLLYGMLRAAASQFSSAHDRALLGKWFLYGFFHSRDGPHFYKERLIIKRHPLLPWRLRAESRPVSAGQSTQYRGRVTSYPPFLYCTGFDPVYHDQTFEILQRKMDARLHDASTFVGIHLGKSYDDMVHTACAAVMTRKELDPSVSETKLADPEVEKRKFLEIVRPYVKLDEASYQLLMM